MYTYNQNGQKIPVSENFSERSETRGEAGETRHPKFQAVERFSMGGKKMKWVWIVIAILAVALIGWAVWYYLIKKKEGYGGSPSASAGFGCGMDMGDRKKWGFRFY